MMFFDVSGATTASPAEIIESISAFSTWVAGKMGAAMPAEAFASLYKRDARTMGPVDRQRVRRQMDGKITETFRKQWHK